MGIKRFEDLEVWKKAKELVMKVYKISKDFPEDENFGITTQIKRSAISVAANIAEGFGRFHYLDKAKFYLNARGSLFELKSHILISVDLRFISKIVAKQLIKEMDQLGVKINNLITVTRKRASEQ